MTRYERVPCTRCGEKTAMSAEQLADLRSKVPSFPPIFIPNVCPRCLLDDPAMKAEVEAWARSEVSRMTSRFRGVLARPLEAIDRFVESLK